MTNEKYSNKNFTNKNLKDIEASDFTGTIRNSCFYQENNPYSDIFPDGIICTFENCNLDNVNVPKGCKVIGGTNKMIKVQNDGNDWIVDEKLEPTIPVCPQILLKNGQSTDPNDLI